MSTTAEARAIEARRQSAEVRAAAGRLRRSVENVIDQAKAVSDPKRRELLRRAAATIIAAHGVREAAERTIPASAPAIYRTLVERETAAIIGNCVAYIRKLDVDHAYSALYDNPISLAVSIDNWCRFASSERKTATPKPSARATARAAFDAEREKVRQARVSATLKAVKTKSADGKPMLLATASSDATDLENDYFTVQALRQMAAGLQGKLIFANHSYRVPEDIVGQAVETSLVKRNGLNMLDLMIVVATENPRAVQVYDMVRAGTRLGVSVGVLVKDAKREKDGRTAILDVVPLEASIVGIPANQTAWTQGTKT